MDQQIGRERPYHLAFAFRQCDQEGEDAHQRQTTKESQAALLRLGRAQSFSAAGYSSTPGLSQNAYSAAAASEPKLITSPIESGEASW